MLKPTFCLLIASLTLAPLSQAKALCVYHGRDNARTTITQEFADSRWVVRARVSEQIDSWTDARRDEMEAPWSVYRIEVLEVFKGNPARTMTVFTPRNSSGFYLEPISGGPDPAAEYLLFLNRTQVRDDDPPQALGTAMVNYSCGQSSAWNALTAEDMQVLTRLARP